MSAEQKPRVSKRQCDAPHCWKFCSHSKVTQGHSNLYLWV